MDVVIRNDVHARIRKRNSEFSSLVAHQKRFAEYLLLEVDARQQQTRVVFISCEYFMPFMVLPLPRLRGRRSFAKLLTLQRPYFD